MDDRRVADYFVVAGLPDDPEHLDETTLSEGSCIKTSHGQAPITDISVIFPSLGEQLPEGYEIVTKTPTGLTADLNHGSLRTIECFLCYKRGRDKPPLVDIGIMYDGKEWLMPDAELVRESVGKHVANVNNSTAQTFITFRRGNATMPCNALVVTDVCIVIASKGESPPHAFCCINKNLNKGIVGSDVFLCYKKSMNRAKLLTYEPAVLSRYPTTDLHNFPFPQSVPLFCLPMGASLESWPKEANQPKPVFSTFVLTVSDAKHKVYGSAVTFYEKFPVDKLSKEQKELLDYSEDSGYVLNMNKSICLLSHWPFNDAFETWLLFLHDIATSGEPQSIPVERYIVQLLDEAPFPVFRTLLELSDDNEKQKNNKVIMTQPEDLPLPRSAAGFKQLLLNLGSENCLQVLLLALTEQKILIHSLRPDTLTAVAEAVSSLLFPFKWQCPYIPLCPLGLVEVLHAPLPFLIGVDSRFFDLYDPPPDVSCIDLDTNIITVAESQRQVLNLKLLPKKPAKSLKASLDYLYYQIRNSSSNNEGSSGQDDVETLFRKKEKEQSQELEIQEAFLRFMALTLKGYRSYLLPITKAPTVGTTDPQALFQLNDFMKSRDKAHHKFFTLMMRTQMFIRFIEERSFVADGDQGLAFFDECSEKLSYEGGEMRLIEFDAFHKSDRTIFVLPPETTIASNHTYTNFTLDPVLLNGKKRALLSYFHQTFPGSPMARRTKHEIKSAQKLAQKSTTSPELWARCLCGTCHTLYFMVLPSMLSLNAGKEKAILQQAYELLVRATQQRLSCDEVCYRLMMQLCAEHSRPLLAVKLLVLMKKFGIQPNALTYGLYNRCVLEAEWPANSGSSQVLWARLRNVVMGAAHFRWAARQKASRKLSASTEGGSSLLDAASRSSTLDAHDPAQIESIFNKFRKVASIVKGSLNGSEQSVKDIEPQSEEEGNNTEDTVQENSFTPPPPGSPSEYRILSRSESAGDANLIDKLQQNKKHCSRTLRFNGEDQDADTQSPGKVSPRTVVTQNDPLGAFEQPSTPPPVTCVTPPEETMPAIPNPILSDDPVLFKSAVHRSATFEGSPPAQNKLHRSETVPAATVASSLASFGSSFKIGFSRYSPSRLSLRKADLKVPQQMIESALNNFSPSSLTGKKSNELIQGGISSIKMAATSMVKKLDEIKEAISTSTNSTPVKAMPGDRLAAGDAPEGECESTDGSDGGERHRRVSSELSYKAGSYSNLKDSDEPLPESLFAPPSEDKQDSELEIMMTSCSQCHNCMCLLYDEDIMANWFAEDSNLNTICLACNKPTVPLLTTIISSKNIPPCDPFSIPYLNPLVLRKELEYLTTQEGDLSLADAKFVDEHPIIYWNLVWAFERINVQTHLPNLYLKIRSGGDTSSTAPAAVSVEKQEEEVSGEELGNVMKPVQEGTDPLTQELAVLEQLAAQVCVRCLWDEPRFHSERPPMYILWKLRDSSSSTGVNAKSNVTKSFMQKIINNIRLNDLVEPLKSLAGERESRQRNNESNKTGSVYRDILFLAIKALGRAQIDLNVFDKEYTTAYSRLTERNNRLYGPQDRPINLTSLYCRQYFRPLTLP